MSGIAVDRGCTRFAQHWFRCCVRWSAKNFRWRKQRRRIARWWTRARLGKSCCCRIS